MRKFVAIGGVLAGNAFMMKLAILIG